MFDYSSARREVYILWEPITNLYGDDYMKVIRDMLLLLVFNGISLVRCGYNVCDLVVEYSNALIKYMQTLLVDC